MNAGVMDSTSTSIRQAGELFEIPAGITYLNSANMAPQLRSVTEAGLDAVCAKASPWKLSARQWFSGAEALRTLATQLFGVDADGIADELPPDQVLERSDSRTFLAHSLLDQGKVIDSIPIYKRSPL